MINNNDNISDSEIGNFTNKEFEIMEKSYRLGLSQAYYLVGFASAVKTLNLSEEQITQIILAKMGLEYKQEMLRMELESNENIAEKQTLNFMEVLKDYNN
jgi:hypothetical protein